MTASIPVPTGWEVRPLKTTVVGCVNGTWGSDPDGSSDDIVCVRVADFDREKDRVSPDRLTVRSVPVSERAGRQLQRGDLLLEKSGGGDLQPVGKVVLFDLDQPSVCSNFIARMRVASGYEPRFLSYLHRALYSAHVNTRAIKQSTGLQNLDSAAYLSERVAIPSLTQQRAVADFLDRETAKLDALIERKHRLHDLLDDSVDSLLSFLIQNASEPLTSTWRLRVLAPQRR